MYIIFNIYISVYLSISILILIRGGGLLSQFIYNHFTPKKDNPYYLQSRSDRRLNLALVELNTIGDR